MRHLISLVALLAMFFLVGPGLAQHMSAKSVLVLASDENKKLSKEEAKAKAQAKRRYNNFMKVHDKIWSLFGPIHDDFDGTPGNIRYARVVKNWQNYINHRLHAIKMESNLFRFHVWPQKTPGGPYERPLMHKLTPAANRLRGHGGNEIAMLDFNWFKQKAQEITAEAKAAKQAMEQACSADNRAKSESLAQRSKEAATAAVNNYKLIRQRWPDIKKSRDEYRGFR